MNYKIYVINFLASNVNFAAFHRYLSDSIDVLAYWNYIPAVYCVKTHLDATALRDRLRPFLPDLMMVAQIDPKNLDGYMPTQEMWSWFYEQPPERKPSLPPQALFGVLGPPSKNPWDT